jgi:hypothetical protein
MTFQTFTPREYLKIDIANNYGHGLDKQIWAHRLAWFDAHESELASLVQTADEPALFYAGIKAWADVLAGKPIGYMISLDATSSGLQLLAALTGDRLAAQICNVVDTNQREDAYQNIYRAMLRKVQDTAKIDPDDVKQACMTSLYGSTAVPKKVFGEGAMLDTFYQTMFELTPGAWELNEAFLKIWDPTALEHSWILPDNFHVHVKVMRQVRETVQFLNESYDVFYNINAPIDQGRSLGANTIHSIDGMIVREMTRRCDYNPKVIGVLRDIIAQGKPRHASSASYADRMVILLWSHFQQTGYLSARILDYLGPDNIGHVLPEVITELMDSLPDKPFKVISIHDCFRCLPHYGNDLRHQYNLQLQLIAKSNLLSNLISQIIGRQVQVGKLDPQLYVQIEAANYALS